MRLTKQSILYFCVAFATIFSGLAYLGDFDISVLDTFFLPEMARPWPVALLFLGSILFLICALLSQKYSRQAAFISIIGSLWGLYLYSFVFYAFFALTFIFFLFYPIYWFVFILPAILLLYNVFYSGKILLKP